MRLFSRVERERIAKGHQRRTPANILTCLLDSLAPAEHFQTPSLPSGSWTTSVVDCESSLNLFGEDKSRPRLRRMCGRRLWRITQSSLKYCRPPSAPSYLHAKRRSQSPFAKFGDGSNPSTLSLCRRLLSRLIDDDVSRSLISLSRANTGFRRQATMSQTTLAGTHMVSHALQLFGTARSTQASRFLTIHSPIHSFTHAPCATPLSSSARR